jgi:hypothetical protein
MRGIMSLDPRAQDLLMLSDVDELSYPSTIRYIRDNPPEIQYRLWGDMFMYSMRWRIGFWIGPIVVRYGHFVTSKFTFADYRRHGWAFGYPAPAFVHCSYCLGRMDTVITKLRSFSHVERSTGRYVDPNFIYSAVACGKHLWKGNVTYEIFEPELVIPQEKCDFMFWKMPFKDLTRFKLSTAKIAQFTAADCKLPPNGINGIWRGFA